jgi:hypothetical protein
MFNEWLARRGAEIEAMILRSPQAWWSDQYVFRFRFGEGRWSDAHILPWGMDTFVRATDIIEEAMP